MRRKKILVTGGAGFIGRKLVTQLAESGHSIIVLDNLVPQVHGRNAKFPDYGCEVDKIQGDIRDSELVKHIIASGVDIVYHLASMTGVGQSMYQIANYVDINSLGTATLMEAVISSKNRPEKIILSSSRAVYGDGRLYCRKCDKHFYPGPRNSEGLSQHIWEHICPYCGGYSSPLETNESSPIHPTSIYGITKYEQEQYCSVLGNAYDIPVTVLRYFNVYGPGQAPNNPYTGVLSIFTRRLLHKQHIDIYEDGQQLRDFVYIDDVIDANLKAGSSDVHGIYNICSGEPVTIATVAEILCDILEIPHSVLNYTNKYRLGDIRHCYSSWDNAGEFLGYQPKVSLREGLTRLVQWMSQQDLEKNDFDKEAETELLVHGLMQ